MLPIFEKLKKEITNTINKSNWPIGRGFIDFTDTDYSNYLGFTWERELVGMTPVGKDENDEDFNEIGKTGGEKTHTQTIEEMPSHTHIQNPHSHSWTKSTTSGATYASVSGGSSGSTSTAYSNSVTPINQDTGGGKPMNIMHPYKVVSYWKRVA